MMTGQKLALAYIYEAPATLEPAILIGPGGLMSWKEAREAEIVVYTDTSVKVNYAAVDGTGAPFVAGDPIAVPDGVKDNRVIDSVAMVKESGTTPSGGGNCDAGAGMLALIAIAGMATVIRRPRG